MKIWTGTLLFLAWMFFCAWLVLVCREKDVHPLRDFAMFFKKQTKAGRIILGTFFIAMWVIASTKPGDGGGSGDGDTNNIQMVIDPGGGLQPLVSPGAVTNNQQQGFQGGIQPPQGGMVGDPAPATDEWTDFTPITSTNTTRTLDGDDFRRGFVMYRIGTDEEFDFSAPPGATVCTDWRSFGAASDWIYVAFTNWVFQVGTNEIDHLRLFSFGKVEPLMRDVDGRIATNSWFAPFMASLGMVPEANWDLLAESDRPSQLWHCITLQSSLVVTWQNALLDRDTDTPLSFQAEFFPDGRFTYRYDLSRLNVETVSNILAGASFGGNGWPTNALPTNVTSMAFYPLSEEDIANQDRDGDGLSLLDELFAFGTDPDLRDTDCDGVSDGEEVAAGTNPRSRDSDGDGLVDGSDPDPAVQTSLADLEGDGIPDAYEDYWFGDTNAFNTATNRDDTGFTLDTKILGGINPTNQVAAANVVSTNGLVSWKLFDAFAADWPANATNLVWERTFTVGRSSVWQQFFVSASPTNAAAWSLRGAVLEWETDTGVSGTAAASPGGDSFRIPLSAEDFPYGLTLRLRAAGGVTVYSPAPLHLIAYAPEFRIDGGNEMTGDSGMKFSVFTDGSDSQISLVIDHSLRPCNATPRRDEGDMTEFENLSMIGSDFSFAGDSSGGTIYASRPTNATDSVSLVREWLYNRRSELAAATVGTDRYGYAYDSIGNRLWSVANAVTNSYTANSLNQYTSVSAGANPVYDADGNMTSDGTFAYAYDAENRLVSVTSAAETNGAIRVLNAYDHRNRRIRKTVQRLNSSIAPPPSPPVGIHEWETQETHTFVWDGNNIVLEKVEFANGTPRTFEYFWGADKSGTEQDAGGVEGLLAVSMDGVFYIPCYDHNGNIILYVSETGSIVAQYTYDPYGNIIESSGPLADVFSFGFSTQYHDRETGMVGYQQRFLLLSFGRWLNRDPIEEDGGVNLYSLINNNPIAEIDCLGLAIIVIKHLPGTTPPTGWPDTDDAKCLALTVYRGPTYSVSEKKYPRGKIGFNVEVNPPNSFVDVYFRTLNDFLTKMQYENDHISVARRHEQAIQDFKRRVESICDCPKSAREAKDKEEQGLIRKVQALKAENAAYDAPGGPHVLRR